MHRAFSVVDRAFSVIQWILVACFAWLGPWSVGNAVAQDWPSIRGPHHDGSSATAAEDPSSGQVSLGVVWKKTLGSGYSGVVKFGDTLVTAMVDAGANQEVVVAMQAADGNILWKTPTGPVFQGANGSFDGPVATPAVDSKAAYHLSPYGRLAAYELTTGQEIWKRDLKTDFAAQPNFYGFGASPILHDGRLIVAVGAPGAAIMAFDPANGDVIWKAGEDAAAFQSAVPVRTGSQTLLIAAGNTKTFGIDPATGVIAWERPHEGGDPMGSWAVMPVPLPGGGVFLADGADTSSGVTLTGTAAQTRWNGREIRNTYCVPVVVDGVLCSYSSRFLVGVDPDTGERLFRSRKPSNGFLGRSGNRLVVATMDGSVHLGAIDSNGFDQVAATDVFDAAVDGRVWSLPAIAGQSIFVRSLNGIARIDVRSTKTSIAERADEEGTESGLLRKLKQLALDVENPKAIVDYLATRGSPIVEDEQVVFAIQSEHDDVAVASDVFGTRQEQLMDAVEGTDWFLLAIEKPTVDRMSYVFLQDYETALDPSNDREVISTLIDKEIEPTFMGPTENLRLNYVDFGEVEDVDPDRSLTGTLTTETLASDSLGDDVRVTIYLPPGYDAEETNRFPVVFCHDGGVALRSGRQAAMVDQLISTNQIRPAIVVFIDRRFYPMRGADGYPAMFAGELIPMIDKKYRTSQKREDRSSLGGGFGGTLGLMASLPASGTIGKLGLHSPFAFELLQPAIKQLANLPGPRVQARIEWGQMELRSTSENWDMANQSRAIARLLAEGGHDVSTNEASIATDWVCWRTRSAAMYGFLVGQ